MASNSPGTTFTFQCDPEFREALDSRARRDGRSSGNLIRHLMSPLLGLTDGDSEPDTEPVTPELGL